VNLPFRLIPVIEEQGKTRVVMNIKAIANFSSQLFATNVSFKIPVPNSTAKCRINMAIGTAKYVPEQNAIVWKVRRFPGGSEAVLNAEIELIMSTKTKPWVRPPIAVDFQVRSRRCQWRCQWRCHHHPPTPRVAMLRSCHPPCHDRHRRLPSSS